MKKNKREKRKVIQVDNRVTKFLLNYNGFPPGIGTTLTPRINYLLGKSVEQLEAAEPQITPTIS